MPTQQTPLRILVLSAYDAASHCQWHKTLAALMPEHKWTVLALPARYFSWRIRGNALSYAFTQRATLEASYDLILATSMVDLSTLRGFVPAIADTPTVVYFHENQFAYPQSEQQRRNAEVQLVPLYSALCADRIVFNSAFNRNSFLAGADALLKQLPDHVPKGLMPLLEAAEVIPVPLLKVAPQQKCSEAPILEILWNHRWEYDKGPGLLLELCKQIATERLPCRMHIAGQQFRQEPPEFDQIRALLKQHCETLGIDYGAHGFVESAEAYETLMAFCDVVLSTAIHDFQGLAIQEATLRGCAPLAPADLAYPEYLPADNLYTRAVSECETAQNILRQLKQWQGFKSRGVALPQLTFDTLTSGAVIDRYRDAFAAAIAAHHSKSPDYSARSSNGKTTF